MPLYTKLGDTGDTMLYGGEHISKDAPRIHAYGTVDELDALLGTILTEESCPDDVNEKITKIQHVLYVVKADLAAPMSQEHSAKRIEQEHVDELEQWIDEAEGKVQDLLHFILPGGSRVGAMLHQARTVCRRAERWVVALSKHDKINFAALRYLNRLGDYFFALGRVVNDQAGVPEARAELY